MTPLQTLTLLFILATAGTTRAEYICPFEHFAYVESRTERAPNDHELETLIPDATEFMNLLVSGRYDEVTQFRPGYDYKRFQPFTPDYIIGVDIKHEWTKYRRSFVVTGAQSSGGRIIATEFGTRTDRIDALQYLIWTETHDGWQVIDHIWRFQCSGKEIEL